MEEDQRNDKESRGCEKRMKTEEKRRGDARLYDDRGMRGNGTCTRARLRVTYPCKQKQGIMVTRNGYISRRALDPRILLLVELEARGIGLLSRECALVCERTRVGVRLITRV